MMMSAEQSVELLAGETEVLPLCPPQIPHGLIQAGTRATVVGSRRPTAWAKARSTIQVDTYDFLAQLPTLTFSNRK
jgi:hypothetical protein